MHDTTLYDKGCWNYIAITADGSYVTTWKNGEFSHSKSYSGDLTTVTDEEYLYIGHHAIWQEVTSPGEEHARLACLQFYDQALTASQIQKIIINCKQKNPLGSM